MIPNQTRSGLFETPKAKSNVAPPPSKSTKYGRTMTKSELDSHSFRPSSRQSDRTLLRSPQSSSGLRASSDRTPGSPKSIDSRSSADRRTPTSNTPRKKPTQSSRVLELQAELNAAYEHLKDANEQLALAEQEKTEALEDLTEAKRQADETYCKLKEALAAREKAEEAVELEKFRLVELEQANIETIQQKEDAWMKKLEGLRSKHALDASNLLHATRELEKFKLELAKTKEEKNSATQQANEALEIAESNAERVNKLTEELDHLNKLLDSRLESKDTEIAERVKRLNSEISSLQQELEKAKEAEKKLSKIEALVEGLREDLAEAWKAHHHSSNLAEEWKKKAESLQVKVDKAIVSERTYSESLASAVKKLEESNTALTNAESEINILKKKIISLDMEIKMLKGELDLSNHGLQTANKDLVEMKKTIDSLKSNLHSTEEEKTRALESENQKALNLQNLSEDRDNLVHELEVTKDELEKSRKGTEDLNSTLYEVRLEAKDLQERLSAKEAEFSDANGKIIELKQSLKTTKDRYETMLEKAKDEIDRLKAATGGTEKKDGDPESQTSEKEMDFMSSLRKSDEELTSLKEETGKLTTMLKKAESEADSAKTEHVELTKKLKEAENKVSSLNKAVEEEKIGGLRIKQRLQIKEKELQSLTTENKELRSKEEAALKKIEELTAKLEEAKRTKENGDISNQAPKKGSGNNKDKHEESEDTKTRGKGLSPLKDSEHESFEDEVSSKADSDSFDPRNEQDKTEGALVKDRSRKKKSQLLRKFGRFLRNKNTNK